MASGKARRFGENKLLYKINGQPMINFAVNAASSDEIAGRLIVTVHEQVKELMSAAGIPCALHTFPDRNQAIRFGIENLESSINQDDGILFMPCDQPGLTRETVSAMCRQFKTDPKRIVRLHDGERPGAPVVFPSSLMKELKELPPKCGGSYVIKAHPELVSYYYTKDPRELIDIDTVEDLHKLSQNHPPLQRPRKSHTA